MGQPYQSRARFAGVLGLIVILAALIYGNSLRAEFVFDDKSVILNNPVVHSVDPAAVWREYPTRFLPLLSFAVNHHAGGERVFGYHLVNLFLHILTALGVYGLLLQLARTPRLRGRPESTRGPVFALLCASLFLVHPVQTQAVTYVVQRITVMAAFFYIITVLFYLKARLEARPGFYAAALFTTVAAMLCKENAFTLPLMLVLCEAVLFDKDKTSLKTAALRLGPFLACLLLIPWLLHIGPVRPGVVAAVSRGTADISRWEYFLTQFNVVATYLRLLFLPVGQNLDYDYRIVQSFLDIRTWVAFVLLGGLLVTAFRFRKKNPLFAFGIFWFFLTLGVESSIIPIRDVIAEHRLYLPSVGIILAVVPGRGGRIRNVRVLMIGGALVVGVLAVLTFQRNQLWRSEVVLWKDVVAKSPEKSRPYDNLAEALMEEGRYDAARAYLHKALEIDGGQAETHINLGLIALAEGRLEEARERIEHALQLEPGSAIAYNDLGLVYLRERKWDQAVRAFREALERKPGMVRPRLNLALAYRRQGETDRAIELYEALLENDPGEARAVLPLAAAYFTAERPEEAVALGKKALEGVRDAGSLTELGSLFAANAYTNMALALYQRALALEPGRADTYLEIGKVYGNLEDFSRAVFFWKEGRRFNPDDPRFERYIRRARELQEIPTEK